jgi:hypothetical protein
LRLFVEVFSFNQQKKNFVWLRKGNWEKFYNENHVWQWNCESLQFQLPEMKLSVCLTRGSKGYLILMIRFAEQYVRKIHNIHRSLERKFFSGQKMLIYKCGLKWHIFTHRARTKESPFSADRFIWSYVCHFGFQHDKEREERIGTTEILANSFSQ